MYRCHIWTGPTLVKQIKQRFRRAHKKVVASGTEAIYVDSKGQTAEGAAWNLLADLEKKYKTSFGLRPKCVLRRKK
jgi:hypothetical protein